MADIEGTSGKAADTGSAVHLAARHWHTNGQDYEASVHAMKEALPTFPLADLHDAELSFRPYTKDPRNQAARVVGIEKPITFTLPPAAHDPTQEAIHVTGTLDQIRLHDDGELYLWDMKTGVRLTGWEMLHHHALQIAAYCVGCTGHFGERVVHPGGIIRTRGYRTRGAALPAPESVFFHYAWTITDAWTLLEDVQHTVAQVRAGRALPRPGDACNMCPARGLDNCLHKLRNIRAWPSS